MKKVVASSMIIGLVLGFVIGEFSNYAPSIEINSTKGIVTSVTKSNHSYIIYVECDCWHGGNKSGFKLHTAKNYQVGDIIKIE